MEKEIKNFKNLMLINKYPDRIPVIIEKNEKIILTNYKYLVPKKLFMSGFINMIRTNMSITEKQAIFIFVKSCKGYVLVPMNESMENIYNLYKCDDSFLYIKFGLENTFG